MMNGAKEESVLASRKVISKNRRFRDQVTIPAAVVSLLLMIGYTAFVMKFAVNVPVGDEWFNSIGIVNSAVHHTLSLSQLWTPWRDGHLFIPGALIGILGPITHFNIRVFIFINCLIYSVSFVVVLTLVRQTTKQAVSFAYALLLGLTWFSLGGIENALWGISTAIYLVILFLLLSLLFLNRSILSTQTNDFLFVCSIACGVLASVTCTQGLIAWPAGLIFIIWNPAQATQKRRELSIWIATSIIMIGISLIGFHATSACLADKVSCSPWYSLHHPVSALSFFLTLVGDIVPSTTSGLWNGANLQVPIHQHLGEMVFILAVVVVVLSWRSRGDFIGSWLAPTLIAIGVIWDLLITIGRVGEGQRVALQSQYNSPQIFILAGVIIGVSLLVQSSRNLQGTNLSLWHRSLTRKFGLVAIFIAFGLIVIVEDVNGVQNAQYIYRSNVLASEIIVNLDLVPNSKKDCFLNVSLNHGLLKKGQAIQYYSESIKVMKDEELSVFEPNVYAHYRSIGIPGFYEC